MLTSDEQYRKQRQEELIRRVIEYREKYGDPIDNLAALLNEIADPDTWEATLNDPDKYGESEMATG